MKEVNKELKNLRDEFLQLAKGLGSEFESDRKEAIEAFNDRTEVLSRLALEKQMIRIGFIKALGLLFCMYSVLAVMPLLSMILGNLS